MDPMRVPVAASMQTGRTDTFARTLDEVVAAREPEPVDLAAARAEDAPSPVAEPPIPSAPEPERESEPSATEGTAADTTADDGHLAPIQSGREADATTSLRREPMRQDPAGRGTESPSPAVRTAEPLLAAAVSQRANGNAPVVATGTSSIQPTAATQRGGQAQTRGVGLASTQSTQPERPPAVAASYRTSSAASAQLLEQARDSVFKQILLKLTGDGGEMRLRLQPPDLGELDLRLVVDGGNRLNLTMAADRPELADLLHRHLGELKQTLQQAGLEISGATVQTRSEFARDQRERDLARSHGNLTADAVADDVPPAPQHFSYISATGLDFWA